MAHFGAICDPGPSHVMAMTAISAELRKLGHRVTLFPFPEFEDPSAAGDFPVWPVEMESDFVRERKRWISQAGQLKAADFLRFTIQRARLVCEHGPRILSEAKIDCALVDGIDPGAATVAEKLGLPFVTINNALPLNQESSVPPDFVPWLYHDAAWARARNWIAYRVRDVAIRSLHHTLNEYRKSWGLKPCKTPDDSFSPYAQITQLVPEFDYPRHHLPDCFHYVGPYRRPKASAGDFPYDRLDGRPLIYASLGTVQGSRAGVWHEIAKSCHGLDAQLVASLGKCMLPLDTPWPANAIVVNYAPQYDLLSRASLAILHGGMNSAMEALATGVPTVTLPVIGDQFGVAARVVYSGTGRAMPASKCTSAGLRPMIEDVLTAPSYRARAGHVKQSISNTRGAEAAAGIIANVLDRA